MTDKENQHLWPERETAEWERLGQKREKLGTKRNCRGLIAAAAALTLAVSGVFGWFDLHFRAESTYTEAKTSMVHGETEEELHEHKWVETNCTSPITCMVCGKTGGEAPGHLWNPATCYKPKACIMCGKTEGEMLEHVWKAASCIHPKFCLNCGTGQGTALGHSWKMDGDNEYCERCKNDHIQACIEEIQSFVKPRKIQTQYENKEQLLQYQLECGEDGQILACREYDHTGKLLRIMVFNKQEAQMGDDLGARVSDDGTAILRIPLDMEFVFVDLLNEQGEMYKTVMFAIAEDGSWEMSYCIIISYCDGKIISHSYVQQDGTMLYVRLNKYDSCDRLVESDGYYRGNYTGTTVYQYQGERMIETRINRRGEIEETCIDDGAARMTMRYDAQGNLISTEKWN